MEVAIKRLKKPITDSKMLKKFQGEVTKMASFNHPHICLFLGACTKPGNFFIVTQYHPRGDVENALHSDRHLSLFTRMKWAKHAALGVNWLHQNNPIFIHRDLKSSNLLIDENDNVLVCDFGLSQTKKLGSMLKDKHRAKGTPLWMAPEVMTFQEFNEKCDVYSFGIVLWELLTRDEPYSEHDDFSVFRKAVCEDRERPPIPEDCPERWADLMKSCWHHNPIARLSMEETLPIIDDIIIDVSISDPFAREFWRTNFKSQEEVSWIDFAQTLFNFLNVPSDKEVGEDEETVKKIRQITWGLSALLTNQKYESLWVHIETFGSFCSWFGPIRDPEVTPWTENILEYTREILSRPWFHGDLSQRESQVNLSNTPGGTFLIRFSTSQPGNFTISEMTPERRVKHKRIDHTPGHGFTFNGNHYPSLDLLLETEGYCLPCVGSKYQYIFDGILDDDYYLSDNKIDFKI
eukprot:TRINITY_DN896_c0_g2_i1.p1 TRINITY_DN896_c0_g2~~TRINITY_DN896_c0_g2_i1.p1  ORF type:complete len:462 (+),score=107.21 TRINITY_DN896_c0_g2_i1:181-1566(+)